jgi:Glycosyl hydrolase family 12
VPAVVYVRTEAVNAVQIDLKPFLDDAAQRPNAIDAAWYVTSVNVGFDIYEGGTGLQLAVANISPE